MPPTTSRPLMLVGTLQGGLLWWLWHAGQQGLWPATSPLCLGALLWAALAVPFAVYLSGGCGMSRRRRGALLVGMGVTYALFGAYAGWMGMPLEAAEKAVMHLGTVFGFGQLVSALVLGFVLIPLVAAWDASPGKTLSVRWHYPQLFGLAWRNALLCVSAGVLAGVFWTVLWAGALLLNSLGLGFIRTLIQEPIFVFPITGLVVGVAFAQGHARADMLVNLRRYWLALNTWLLPLILVFGVMWVVALPFTGIEPLFKTQNAAFVLLWFMALAITFLNAAWQDGRETVPYPPWLAHVVRVAWLTLVVVTVVAAWALALRIGQYGWTEDRLWAAVVWLFATGHVVGYAVSVLPRWLRQGWMATVGQTNIAVALLMLLCLALLVSPVADPRRLAVNDQVARLQAGLVSATEFDYPYLRFNAGRWGLLALQALGEAQGDARTADIAVRARQSLAQVGRWGDQSNAKSLTNEDARARIQVLPVGTVLDNTLLDYLRNTDDWRSRDCLQPVQVCVVWMHDFNGDGRAEPMLLTSADQQRSWAQGVLLVREKSGWAIVAEFNDDHAGIPMKEWLEAIAQKRVKMMPTYWPDIVVNGKRVRIVESASAATARVQ